MRHTQEDAENCLSIVLAAIGSEGRATIRRLLLEHVDHETLGDDYRRALETLNRWERAFDELDRRTRT